MPQMAPLWWFCLYSFFSSLLMITIIISFFNFSYLPNTKNLNTKNLWMVNWKW